MITLHYIDKFDPILLHQEYFKILAREVRVGDEVHLLMPKPDFEKVEIEGVKIHYLSFFRWMVWRNKRRFRKLMDDVNPDLLHIHSCWSHTTARLLKWNDKYYKRPYIFSTHKMMMPWHMQNCKIKRKLQSFLYQDKVINNADVVLVDSSQEMNIPYGDNVKLIPNALMSFGSSETEMCKSFNQLYEKISNSKPYLFMSDEERHQETNLLKQAIAAKYETKDGSKAPVLDNSLKKIALHAVQEGTLSLLKDILPYEVNEFVEEAPRFTYTTKKSTVPLQSIKILAHRSSLKSIAKEESATEAETNMIQLLINVDYEIEHELVSQLHLIELYEALIYQDYNEDTLNTILLRMNLHQNVARLMQLMKDYYNMPEGFMPMVPLNDKTTDEIKTKLRLLQIQA